MTAGTQKAFLIGKTTNAATWTGTFIVNGSVWFQGGNLYAASDERLKSIKGEVKVDLDELSNVRKVFYTFLSDETNKVDVGVIAQDIQKICPEIVGVDENGYLSVAYDRLSILALSAIDDLYIRVKKLEERILNK